MMSFCWIFSNAAEIQSEFVGGGKIRFHLHRFIYLPALGKYNNKNNNIIIVSPSPSFNPVSPVKFPYHHSHVKTSTAETYTSNANPSNFFSHCVICLLFHFLPVSFETHGFFTPSIGLHAASYSNASPLGKLNVI